MVIEFLFPELCNLFGDPFNIKYLRSCSDSISVIETGVNSEPAFVSRKVDMIYIGAMTERTQQKVIQTLLPYKERICELINDNTVFLATGNAMEVFGSYIETDEDERIEALSVFELYSVRRMMKRHNSTFIGTFGDIEIVGFKSQFSMMYGDNSGMEFATAIKGIGINPDTRSEGIHVKNFFGTYLLGPLLVLNPEFTKYLFTLCGEDNAVLSLEREVTRAYNKRREEFMRL